MVVVWFGLVLSTLPPLVEIPLAGLFGSLTIYLTVRLQPNSPAPTVYNYFLPKAQTGSFPSVYKGCRAETIFELLEKRVRFGGWEVPVRLV